MTTLTEIIKRLNQRIAASNIFDKIYGLSEVNPNKDEKGYVHYTGNGQAEVVTNFDAVRGTIFWIKRGSVSTSPEENLRVSGCKKMYRTTFPLTAYCVVRKSHLPCDSSESEDWIGGEVNRYLAGIDFGFKQSLGVMAYEVLPSSYSTDVKTLPANPEWACLTVDFNVYIVTDTAEGCYNLCTGDPIPLPPAFEACQPCLTQVYVDDVTITGNGTQSDPLVAIGGGGGGSIRVQNEGTTLTNAATNLDFIGNAVNAVLNAPGDVHININQVQSDWNAVSGVAEILNKPTIPAGGLPAGGTAGQILTKVDATDYNATWQENYADWTSVVKHIVKNNGASGTITKGTAVYVTGSNGTNMLVGRASNASEATSSKTMGLMESDITTTGSTQTGFVITEGLLGNLNTAGTTAGDPVWLGVNGALIYGLTNKPYAPAHLVFIGIVTKVSAGNGEIFVKVQNGFELKEIHDVDIITVTPINGHLLGFDGTLWVNKTIAGWLGFTPENVANKSTDVATDQASNTKYPSVKSVFDWASSVFTTASAVASQITAALTGYATEAWVNSQGFITNVITALGYTPVTNARTLTINGTAYDLTADRSWTIPVISTWKDTTTGTVSSGTSNTVSKTQLIAANTFAVGDVIEITFGTINKVGGGGGCNIRMYVNDTPDLTGTPQLISLFTASNTASGARIFRQLTIKSATVTETLQSTTSSLTDITNNPMANFNINHAANKYYLFCVQNVGGTDVTAVSYYTIKKI